MSNGFKSTVRPARAADLSRNYTGPRLQPRRGCYVVAFIDRDDNLPHRMVDSQTYGDGRAFDRKTGQAYASFLMYRRYSARKPSCIGEYAASHEVEVDHRPRSGFSIARIVQLSTTRSWERVVKVGTPTKSRGRSGHSLPDSRGHW